ncbi:hypothetical protein PoB_005610800 [Plakobranchus ocellatus]|uniref:Uncharacterized protein n=1 Tax=Plakobranchus ocellatus TaxID=259542 RepID=A0AAV4CCK2_9GAST|nr:hypothetical protein PoB_005610800 [Plakobranchus ocellatus]
MASENINDHEVLSLWDLSDSEEDEWIPDTDEEWDVTDEEDDPEPNREERRDCTSKDSISDIRTHEPQAENATSHFTRYLASSYHRVHLNLGTHDGKVQAQSRPNPDPVQAEDTISKSEAFLTCLNESNERLRICS